MRAAVNTFVHSVDGCGTADTELSDLPSFCNRKINSVEDFRKAVVSMHDSVPCAMVFGTENLEEKQTNTYGHCHR